MTHSLLSIIGLCLSTALMLILTFSTYRLFTRHNIAKQSHRYQKRTAALIIITLILAALGLWDELLPTRGGDFIGLNLSFWVTLAVSSWLILVIILLGMRGWSIHQVGLIVYPLAAISFLLPLSSTAQRLVALENIWPLEAHIWLSLVAYSLLCIAAIQAAFVALKENHLKHRRSSGFINSLPSLADLESTLLRLVWISYLCLSLSLLTGFIFLENFTAPALLYKVILSVVAWILLTIFFIGHRNQGWRGQRAALWILFAFGFVLVGFIGSRFVHQFI